MLADFYRDKYYTILYTTFHTTLSSSNSTVMITDSTKVAITT